MIRCSTSYGQTDTNYIPTHKHVLKYLYEQDVNCKYLIKDTIKKSAEINLLQDVIQEKDGQYKDCQERILIEKERNSLDKIEIKQLKKDKKKSEKTLALVGILAVAVNVVKDFFIVKLLIN